MRLLCHFIVSRFYAYEMEVYMNLGIFNISKSCFGMYSLFFFSFDGFDMLDVLFFCDRTFDIQILLDDQCIMSYSINITEK